MQAETALELIGFEPHERTIYLFLLKEGASSQQTISDKTGILRQTVYEVMNKMESKGYVSVSKIGKRKHYTAIQPKILLNRLREKEEQFLQILPELEELKEKEKITISSETFIGIEGLKNLVNLTLQSKSEILWLANKKIHDKIFKEYYWHNYAQKRIQKKIPLKLLIEPTKDKDWNTDSKVWRETKRSKLVGNFISSFIIFDNDKVIIYSLDKKQLFGVFIQNKTTKESFEKIFKEFWKEANKDVNYANI